MVRQLELGIVGLGRIGGGLALQARDKGMRVVGYDRGPAKQELLDAGVEVVTALEKLRGALAPPRAVFLYIPAGQAVDGLIDALVDALEPGDVIVDGGNSYWGDSLRREGRVAQRGLHFCDVGTSGGVAGARHGACFMAGGKDDAIAIVEPILVALAVPGGYVHAGRPGSGHFTKLVHNGIEFGVLQAIGEGVELLRSYNEPLDVAEVLRCWRNGSVIRSWLIDLMEESYRSEKPGIDNVPPYVEDTGEVNWLIGDAMRLEVPIPVIAQAVMQLFESRNDRKDWARAIAMMRHGFGGHPFGQDEAIQRERREGRVGGIVPEPEV